MYRTVNINYVIIIVHTYRLSALQIGKKTVENELRILCYI